MGGPVYPAHYPSDQLTKAERDEILRFHSVGGAIAMRLPITDDVLEWLLLALDERDELREKLAELQPPSGS